MKAKHQDVETLLTEKFLTERTYFIVHLHFYIITRIDVSTKGYRNNYQLTKYSPYLRLLRNVSYEYTTTDFYFAEET